MSFFLNKKCSCYETLAFIICFMSLATSVSGLQKDHQCAGTVRKQTIFRRKFVTPRAKERSGASNTRWLNYKRLRWTNESLPAVTDSDVVSFAAAVLKRWKLNWCDLWIDGSLCFYKSDSRRDLELRVSLKMTCIDVRTGLECGGTAAGADSPMNLTELFQQAWKGKLFWFFILFVMAKKGAVFD